MNYQQFLEKKILTAPLRGIDPVGAINSNAFDYQAHCIEYLLKCGQGAAFLDTGMGKSLVSLEWARHVHEYTNKPILMLAPLAVGKQHEREAEKFNLVKAKYIRDPQDIIHGVNIINYEIMHKFADVDFGGVVLDESSIIKSFNGATTRKLMERFKGTRFKLACTATPSPNDHMELGQHSQFLEVMDSSEMLARFFIADQEEMGRYRIKKHGVRYFWRWVASWARCAARPSDLGFCDDGFILPELKIKRHELRADIYTHDTGMLFRIPDNSATAIHIEKRITAKDRAEKAASLVNPDVPCVIWCDTDYEADELVKSIPFAVDVRGSMKPETKEDLLNGFSTGQFNTLITKPKVAGFGLNWQHCNHTIFAGVSYSYESYYQAVRRFYRFGQTKPVNVDVVMCDTEANMWQSVQRKMRDHENMKEQMAKAMRDEVVIKGVKNAYEGIMRPDLPSFLTKGENQ